MTQESDRPIMKSRSYPLSVDSKNPTRYATVCEAGDNVAYFVSITVMGFQLSVGGCSSNDLQRPTTISEGAGCRPHAWRLPAQNTVRPRASEAPDSEQGLSHRHRSTKGSNIPRRQPIKNACLNRSAKPEMHRPGPPPGTCQRRTE